MLDTQADTQTVKDVNSYHPSKIHTSLIETPSSPENVLDGNSSWIKRAKDPFDADDVSKDRITPSENVFEELRGQINEADLLETQPVSDTQRLGSFISPDKTADRSLLRFTFDQTQPRFTQNTQLEDKGSEKGLEKEASEPGDTTHDELQKALLEHVDGMPETQKMSAEENSFKEQVFMSSEELAKDKELAIQIPNTLEQDEKDQLDKESETGEIVYTSSQRDKDNKIEKDKLGKAEQDIRDLSRQIRTLSEQIGGDNAEDTVNQLPDIGTLQPTLPATFVLNSDTQAEALAKLQLGLMSPTQKLDPLGDTIPKESTPKTLKTSQTTLIAESSPVLNLEPDEECSLQVDSSPVSRPHKRKAPSLAEHTPQKHKRIYISQSDDEPATTCSAVWVYYNFRYYPGVVLSLENDTCNILFYDGEKKAPRKDIICALDLNPGDTFQSKDSKGTYTVVDTGPAEDTISCAKGHGMIYAQKATKALRKRKKKTLEFSWWDVFLTEDEWQARSLPGEVQVVAQDGTPVPTGGRERRTRLERVEYDHNERSSVRLALTSPVRPVSGIFENRAFCLTGSSEDKDELAELVIENGGLILPNGFEDILSVARDDEGNILLIEVLRRFYNVRFAACIASQYGRSLKYLQALALGWPVLSTQFLRDCVEKGCWLDNWSAYLLAAGMSSVVGAVQSIDLGPFKENYGGVIADQLSNNSHVFRNVTVFLAQRAPEMADMFFHILGAHEVVSVDFEDDGFGKDFTDAVHEKMGVKRGRFVYYRENWGRGSLGGRKPRKTTKSRARRPKTEPTKRTKKNSLRRINSIAGTLVGGSTKKDTISIELVDWEWVVQCIISGYCWPGPETVEI